jgi:peptidoglycan/xylan/chitin deacetylase (PgdA/CDA1 family)
VGDYNRYLADSKQTNFAVVIAIVTALALIGITSHGYTQLFIIGHAEKIALSDADVEHKDTNSVSTNNARGSNSEPNSSRMAISSYLMKNIHNVNNTLNNIKNTKLSVPVDSTDKNTGASRCVCVVFRIDDIQDYWLRESQISVMNTFLAKNKTLSLEIIMSGIGNDSKIIDKVKEGVGKGLFELGIHGWKHVDYTKLSELEQMISLDKAKNKMQQIFDVKSTIFVPPQGYFDSATINAMHNVGLMILSSDNASEYRYDLGKSAYHAVKTGNFEAKTNSPPGMVYHMSAATLFTIQTPDGNWVNPHINNTITSIDKSIKKYGYSVVVLHPQGFVKTDANGRLIDKTLDQTKLRDLSKLIDLLNLKNITIKNFAQIISG